MRTHNITISSTDHDRLLATIGLARLNWRSSSHWLNVLEGELGRATIVAPSELPGDVIAISSRVSFQDLDTQERERYQIVLPADADVTCRRISVLSHLGIALLGFRRGDTVEWQLPHGRRRLAILEVVQQAADAAEAAHVNSEFDTLAKGISRERHFSSPPSVGVCTNRDGDRSSASRPAVAV
jgi:regulator of nucleoside diphosphate kinase